MEFFVVHADKAWVWGEMVLMNSSLYLLGSFCFSVLVNNSLIGFYSSYHGLRQGDPLSPLLFVIVIETLSMMILAAVSGGMLCGLFLGRRIDISHLLFAYDTLLFCGVDPNHLLYLRILSYVLKLCRA